MSETRELRHEAPRASESQLAEEIERLGGVLAAAVHLGEGSEIRDVYVAAAEGAAIPAIHEAATDVLRRAGLVVRPASLRVGSVANPAPAAPGLDGAPPAHWPGRFLLLDNLSVERADNHVTCHIKLVRLGEPFEASCTELDTDLGRARASARATLAAAEQTSPSALGLEGAHMAELFGRRYVVVSIEATAARRFVVLSGILALDGARSIEEAAALATLGAVERFISW